MDEFEIETGFATALFSPFPESNKYRSARIQPTIIES